MSHRKSELMYLFHVNRGERHFLRMLVCLTVWSLFGLVILAKPVAAKRIAFVVGNSSYDNLGADQQLDNPVHDAREISRKLVKLGFDVEKGEDLTRTEFFNKWQEILDKTSSDDTLAFFYSGHGVEIDGQNYLLPSNIPYFKYGRHSQLKHESISVSDLLADLRSGDRQPPKVTVVILDACRDDPTIPPEYKKTLGRKRGLAQIPTPQGTFIMYAAAPGSVSLDRLGPDDTVKTSVYTRTLLPLLEPTSLSIQDLAIKVRESVYELTKVSTGFEQIPEYTDGIIGRFCLGGCVAQDSLPVVETSTMMNLRGKTLVPVEGLGCYAYSENENLNAARATAMTLARENAVSSNEVWIETKSSIDDDQLKKYIIQNISAGTLRQIQVISVRRNIELQEICVRIKAMLEPSILKKNVNDDLLKRGSGSNLR